MNDAGGDMGFAKLNADWGFATWRLAPGADVMADRSSGHDQLYGYAETQAVWGQASPERHMVADDVPKFRRAFAEARSKGGLSVEVRVHSCLACIRWIAVKGQVEAHGGGQPAGIAGVVIDITASKQEESRHRESLEDLQQAQAVARLGSWRFEIEAGRSIWSKQAYRIFGLPAGKPMPLQASLAFTHPADVHCVKEAWEATRHGETYDVEYRIVVEDEIRWVREVAKLTYDSSGVLSAGHGIFQDISDRKTAEESWARLDRRYRLALDAAGMGSWEADITHDKFIWDKNCYKLLGYEPGQVIPGVAAILSRIPQPERDEAKQALVANLSGRKAFSYEHCVIRPLDGERWIEVRGRSEYDAVAETTYSVGIIQDITDRKRLEHRLWESERGLKRAQEIAKIGSWQIDFDTRILTWSDETYRIFKIPVGTTVTEQDYADKIHPEDRDAVRAIWNRAKLSGDQYRAEYRIIVDDEVRWVAESAVLSRSPSGAVVQQLGTIHDVTDHKLAELAAVRSEAHLKLALEAGGLGGWEWDTETDSAIWTEQVYRILGYEPGAVTANNESWRARLHPLDMEWTEATLEYYRRAACSFHLEYRIITPSGETRWVEEFGRYFAPAEGTGNRCFGTIADITSRKQAEIALTEGRERLKLALEAGNMGIWSHDARSGAQIWDAGLYRIIGCKPDAVPSTAASWRALVHPADLAFFDEIRVRQSQLDQPFTREYRIVTPAGETRWVETTGRYVKDADGEVLRSYGVVTDISARKHAEQHQQMLMREVNHRAKNLLQVVKGIVLQAAGEGRPENFANLLSERLNGLAATHDLLVTHQWRPIAIDELIDSQLKHFSGWGERRIVTAGPRIMLNVGAVQPLGMAFHELGTNAVKYGALSNWVGRIAIDWQIVTQGHQAEVLISWREKSGPPPVAPTCSGFGTMVISDALAHKLGAKVEITYPPEGLVWQLRVKLKKIGIDEDT